MLANASSPDQKILEFIVSKTYVIEVFDKFTYLLSSGNINLSEGFIKTLSFVAYKLTMQKIVPKISFDTRLGINIDK